MFVLNLCLAFSVIHGDLIGKRKLCVIVLLYRIEDFKVGRLYVGYIVVEFAMFSFAEIFAN